MLECKNIVKHAGDKVIANNISLTVNKGQLFTILGESGAGKTTLLRIIAGFTNPENGEIIINNNVMFNQRHCKPPVDRSVGLVFQNTCLFPHMTVLKNIQFVISNYSKAQQKLIIDNIVDRLCIANLLHKLPAQLSGGEQQKVVIARILCKNINVLLLDEPFSALDRAYREEMREELVSIVKSNNLMAILVTHDYEEAFAVSDKIAILKNGLFMQVGSPADIYNNPVNEYVAKTVGKANVINTASLQSTQLNNLANLLNTNSQNIKNKCVIIRPEDITINLQNKQHTVLQNIFYGSYSVAKIDVFGIKLKALIPSINNSTLLNVGSNVNVNVTSFVTV